MYIILYAIWRRWFGWGNDIPIIKERGVQCLAFIVLMTYQLITFGYNQYLSFIVAIYSYACVWAGSIGFGLDAGFSDKPSQETIARYDECLGIELARYLIPSNRWYGKSFDFLLNSIRYGVPSLPLCFFTPWFALFGVLIATVYYLCNRYPVSFILPKNLAEIFAGLIFGLIITFGG